MRRLLLVLLTSLLVVPVVPVGADERASTGTLTIRLRTPDGQPYTSTNPVLASFMLVPGGVGGSMSDSEITVQVPRVSYLNVRPHGTNENWVAQWWPLAGSELGARPIVVPPGQSRTVDVVIHPAGTLRGSADDGNGGNCGANVHRLEENGWVTQSRADELAGTAWEAQVLPGTYRVRSACLSAIRSWFGNENHFIDAETLTVAGGTTTGDIDVDTRRAGADIGVIPLPAAESLEGIRVCAELLDETNHVLDALPGTTRGEYEPFGYQSGTVFFQGVPAGTYRLRIVDCFGAGIEVAYAGGRPTRAGSTRIVVGRGDETVVEIPVAHQGSICHGRIATIEGSSASDLLTGTEGADVIMGLGGDDTLDGLEGNDRLCGGGGDDMLIGDKGHDLLDGGFGRDSHDGGKGRDRTFGNPGADTNDGGPGIDRIDHRWSPKAVSVDLLTGANRGGTAGGDTTTNTERIAGSPNNDKLRGDDLANIINGRGGVDLLNGRGGIDTCINGETVKGCELP
ncbi:MAG: calcium-binding protein [Acidimicrobiales bacterium]